MHRLTFCSTPASRQYSLACRVYSSLMSHAMTCPSGGRAKAAASEEAPVKTPMSITFLAPNARIKRALRLTISGAPIMIALGWSIVCSKSFFWTLVKGEEFSTQCDFTSSVFS
eukprot:14021.XXX_707790_708128_1 [CDS] Oithona nana genome sequencing.